MFNKVWKKEIVLFFPYSQNNSSKWGFFFSGLRTSLTLEDYFEEDFDKLEIKEDNHKDCIWNGSYDEWKYPIFWLDWLAYFRALIDQTYRAIFFLIFSSIDIFN